MGGTFVMWMTLLMLLCVTHVLTAATTSAVAKRTDENIQFGNQQNKPVSVLDEDVLTPGAFPSSETNAEETEKPITDLGDEENHTQTKDTIAPFEVPPPPSPPSSAAEKHLQSIAQHLTEHHRPIPLHREEMIRDLPPVALASRWRSPSHFYNPHWGRPLSPLFGNDGGEDGTFPVRRRRSANGAKRRRTDWSKLPQVSLHALRTGHRHKREVRDIRRIRRDLSDLDLDKLRREVDVVELLAMLTRPTAHHNPRFATVTYAPLAPAPPRYAPQPKLFPDYEEEEEDDDGGVGYLRQNTHQLPQSQPDDVIEPSGGRVWRRSGARAGYGLSALPGFKRSGRPLPPSPLPASPPGASSFFRENSQHPSEDDLQNGDIISLAALMGAMDPVHHRVRRVAM
ncbi:hypothetical protein SK128_012971 [Halocaridina rubra]|uniref:Uncharacterized protein n=1 Tax=Halocaridina rubra TaxID=373956 RepID=A0AAN8X233_HALRR